MDLKRLVKLGSLALAGVAVACGSAAARDPVRVKVPANGVTLAAVMYRPDGEGPFPAVVALHGCAGLFGRDGQVSRREADWGERLAAQGFVVLLPDSFGSRGLGPQCRSRERKARASVERRDDAHAARRWLQDQSFVKGSAVSLMGWSNGGTTGLYAIRNERTARPGRGFRVIGEDFARAVLLYPGCRTISERPYRPRMPLLVLAGQLDEWTPARYCEQVVNKARAAGADASITVFPGAHHDFDWPDRPVMVMRGVIVANRTMDVFSGTNTAARAEALTRVPAFLAR
ncbi:dienelactone hydrolase family protein [Alsobacter sp. R-9]